MEHSPPQYRAAFGFDQFENALICQMSRSSNVVGLLARLPGSWIGPGRCNLSQTSGPYPDVPSPDTSGGSPLQKQHPKKSNTNPSPSKMHTQGSPSKGAHLTSNVYVTNSGNNEVFSTPYMAEDRDDFVETMTYNGVPEEASGFIWEMYFGLVDEPPGSVHSEFADLAIHHPIPLKLRHCNPHTLHNTANSR
ncbi:hypothetical protein ARMGADRAFT_1034086 [Armillaria gallica]|uniref:Uncharacterized protein n=1 Tax=Armillaria gallica TaxID=47427 RepID=A0A2H3CZK1_ARMGA|nr:hypothetical protein ARMGADRAFT_1034086 [Armillaria gallica]